MNIEFPLFAGILAAAIHVLTGPDHLAAVTPFAIESKKKAWKVGLSWGIGHLLGMSLIGLLFLLFKELIPVERISGYSEKLVGIILIIMGLWIFYTIFRKEKHHKHTHVHTDGTPVVHKHEHIHKTETKHDHHHADLKQGTRISLSVGVVHGFAGISHFLLFLPVLGFTSTFDSLTYIIGFCVGTLIAMISYALVIGNVAAFSKRDHNDTFFKGIRLTGGLFAFIIGIYWVIAA
ncbi:MAG: sulfite exporter TauE/SafE family protein [Flavobacteriaceae bacterium]|nr:sulfite exporter TauE/SafE family protein [Flavobacteriaceae bacterium]